MTACKSRVPSRHLIILFLFSVLLLLPTVLFGPGGGDMLTNCMHVRLFAQQFWHGDLYPRWLMDQFAGNGSPLFFYYPPLAYFITSFFVFLSPLDAFGYTPIAASVWLAALIAGIGFYLWMKDEKGDAKDALIGSLLYMSAPIMIGWNFYYFMLFPSVWAWAWLPLIMLCTRRTMLGDVYAVGGLALALAALITTNVPMTIIFGPLSVAYAALYSRRNQILQQGMLLGVAILLGFALASIFLIPAFFYLDYSNARMFWTISNNDFHRFLTVLGFRNFDQSLYTLYTFAMAALTLIYCFAIKDKPRKYFFFAAASLAGLFMTLWASVKIWEAIPILRMLQFSERFFMVPALCLAVLASLASPRLRWLNYGLLAAYTACMFIPGNLSTYAAQHDPRKFDHFGYERFALNVDFVGLLTSPEIIPQYFSPFGLAKTDTNHPETEAISGDAAAEVLQWRPRNIVLHYKASKPSTLRIRQFYYPGTVAFLGKSMREKILDIDVDEQTKQLLLTLPPGEGDVHVELTALMPEAVGKLISITAASIIFLGALIEFKRRQQATNPPLLKPCA